MHLEDAGSNVPLPKRGSSIKVPRVNVEARTATAFLFAQSMAVCAMVAVGSCGRCCIAVSCKETHFDCGGLLLDKLLCSGGRQGFEGRRQSCTEIESRLPLLSLRLPNTRSLQCRGED
jgi:hypothetical protein